MTTLQRKDRKRDEVYRLTSMVIQDKLHQAIDDGFTGIAFDIIHQKVGIPFDEKQRQWALVQFPEIMTQRSAYVKHHGHVVYLPLAEYRQLMLDFQAKGYKSKVPATPDRRQKYVELIA